MTRTREVVDLGLDGRVAIVTGASRGIGRAIADVLEAEGALVARASRSSAYAPLALRSCT